MFIISYIILCVIIHFSSSTLTDIAITNPTGSAEGIFFKTSGLASVSDKEGDINGDGIKDLIIGDKTAGTVFVIFGGTTLTGIDLTTGSSLSATGQGFKISGVPNLGWSVSAAGDINADGVDDVIIGTNTAVYVVYGSNIPGILTDIGPGVISNLYVNGRGFQITGGTSLGNSVSGAGDINGDGVADFIVGDRASTSGAGMVFVIYGRKPPAVFMDMASTDLSNLLSNSQGFKIQGIANGELGLAVSAAGDVNDDGVDDIIVGADHSYSNNGVVYVIYGAKAPTVLTNINSFTISTLFTNGKGFQIRGTSASDYFGLSVSSAGDINRDGVADIIFGSSSIAYVVFGSKAPNIPQNIAPADVPNLFANGKGFQIQGVFAPYPSIFVNNAGDVNHDGIDDIIVGNPQTGSNAGSAYIIYGNKTTGLLTNIDLTTPPTLFTAGQGFTITGTGTEQLGYYVCGAGDLNGDNGADIVVASVNGARVIFGQPPTTPIPAVVKVIARALDIGSQATSLATLAVSVISFSNPGSMILSSGTEVLMYLKLLKINYPPRLEYLLDNSGSGNTIFSDMLSAPEAISDEATQDSMPEKFEKAGLSPSFLMNFWSSLITLASLLALVLLVTIFKPCQSSSRTAHSQVKKIAIWLYSKLREAVKWNLMLSIFTGCYGDISLFTAVEFRTVQFNSAVEDISFPLCILVNLAAFFFLAKLIHIIHQLQKAQTQSRLKNDPAILETTKHHLKDFEALFEIFKEDSFLQQSFMIVFNLKMYMFYAAAAYFPDYPLVPTLVNTLIGFFMFLYLVILRPLKERIELGQFIFAELVFVLMNACTACLALDEVFEMNFGEARATIGDIIIVCNCLFMIVISVFLLIQIYSILRDLFRFIKSRIQAKKLVNMNKAYAHTNQATNTSNSSQNQHKQHDTLDSLNISSFQLDTSEISLTPVRNSSLGSQNYHKKFQRPTEATESVVNSTINNTKTSNTQQTLGEHVREGVRYESNHDRHNQINSLYLDGQDVLSQFKSKKKVNKITPSKDRRQSEKDSSNTIINRFGLSREAVIALMYETKEKEINKKPQKDKIELVHFVLAELIFKVINICAVCVFLIIKIYRILKDFYQFFKKKKTEKKKSSTTEYTEYAECMKNLNLSIKIFLPSS